MPHKIIYWPMTNSIWTGQGSCVPHYICVYSTVLSLVSTKIATTMYQMLLETATFYCPAISICFSLQERATCVFLYIGGWLVNSFTDENETLMAAQTKAIYCQRECKRKNQSFWRKNKGRKHRWKVDLGPKGWVKNVVKGWVGVLSE